jgi:hypothetical protein
LPEDDKVVVRATNKCIQESFLGVPSYGIPQVFTATFVHRIVNNKIVETWRNADDLGRLLQIGSRDCFSRCLKILGKSYTDSIRNLCNVTGEVLSSNN